jgi:hypothetical protein
VARLPERQLEIGSPRSVAATAKRHVTTLRDSDRRTQVQVDRFPVRDELPDLPLAPGKLFVGNRPTKQLIDKPNPIGIQDVRLTIPSHFLDLQDGW